MQTCETQSISSRAGLALVPGLPASLKVEGLCLKRTNQCIVQNLSFEARAGEVIVLKGCSGAGKSTLLAALFGELAASEGTIRFSSCQSRGDLGILFQDLRLCEELSVLENILAGRLHRLKWWNFFMGFQATDQERAYAIACDLGLEALIHKSVKFLSGGERQRVALGRLLFQDPKVILADEPVSSLDPKLASKVLKRLKWEAQSNQKLVICALHDRDLSLDFADRIIELC